MSQRSLHLIFLTLLISLGFVVRVSLLWYGRPEFVGWFTHTYYYYVQSLGLLERGQLPFPDMPFVFILYAGTAKLIAGMGIPLRDAIVHSSRFWMCLFPALLPLPIYGALKRMGTGGPFSGYTWALVILSGFLPLTLMHLPEFSQKNVLGLLWLALLLASTQKWLGTRSLKAAWPLLVLTALMLLTHFGSSVAMILFGLSLLGSLLYHSSLKRPVFVLLMALAGTGIALGAIALFDSQRFFRIGYYLANSLPASWLGILFSPGSEGTERLFALLGVLLPAGLHVFLYGQFTRIKDKLSLPSRQFLLSKTQKITSSF